MEEDSQNNKDAESSKSNSQTNKFDKDAETVNKPDDDTDNENNEEEKRELDGQQDLTGIDQELLELINNFKK